MCWFYRVRYSCGGEVWGERQRQCAISVKSERTTTESPCSTRHPARRLFNLSECPVCTGEILLDAIGDGEDAGVTWATAHEALTLCLITGPNKRASARSTERLVSGCIDYIKPYLDRRLQRARRFRHNTPAGITIANSHTHSSTGNYAPNGFQPRLSSQQLKLENLAQGWMEAPFDNQVKVPFFNTQGRVQDRESCLIHLRRLERNSQPTALQAYKYFADILCTQCNLNPGHTGEHKLKCPQVDCTLKLGHEGPHSMLDKFRWCDHLDCTRELNHSEPHSMVQQQTPRGTWDHSLTTGHSRILDSRDLAARLSLVAREGRRQLEELNRKVLEDMTDSDSLTKRRRFAGVQANLRQQKKFESSSDDNSGRQIDVLSLYNPQRLIPSSQYDRLDQASNQIRLFKLEPGRTGDKIQGSFLYTHIEKCLSYTAVSYAWGESVAAGTIRVGENDNLGTDLHVADNLLRFLHVQSRMITEPKLFWIDAICINQSDLRERNHQVGLMKLIYTKADDVYVWLGRETDDSKLAMRFLSCGGPKPLRPRGSGFYPVWTPREARALVELCERPYWRRMWIIQEVIHADKIRVWCGDQSAEWAAFDNLYCTLKTLDDMGWSTHHRHAIAVLQSSALTMVWQRAHWRHPETPVPTLQTLVEVFQEWKCSDLRDKVYALVGIAAIGTAVVPDYSRSARQVYFDVIKGDLHDKPKFCDLLSQLLGLGQGGRQSQQTEFVRSVPFFF